MKKKMTGNRNEGRNSVQAACRWVQKTGCGLLCCFLLIGVIPAQAADGTDMPGNAAGETEGSASGETEENMAEEAEILREFMERLASGELNSPEEITEAIREMEESLGITLSGEQRERLTGAARALEKLPLDTEPLSEAAQELYDEYGSELAENVDEAIEEQIVEPVKEALLESIKNTIRDFFRQIGEALRHFFSGIFG